MKYAGDQPDAGGQPAARAAVLAEEQAANPTPDEVRAMHDQLLSSYAGILLRSSQLPALIRQDRWGAESRRQVGDLGPVWRGLFLLSIPFDALLRLSDSIAFRFLVLPFIESHINQRLSQLDRAYLYLTYASPVSIVLPSADWLVAARAQVRDLNETLKPWTSVRSLLRFLGPPVVGILGALGGGTIYEAVGGASGKALYQLGWAVISLAFYSAVVGASSFHYKRWLFLQQTPHEADGTSLENTYRAEVGLWAALDLRRKPEPAIDEILHALASVGFAIFLAPGVAGSLGLRLGDSQLIAIPAVFGLVYGVLVCGFLAAALVSLKAAAMRQPR